MRSRFETCRNGLSQGALVLTARIVDSAGRAMTPWHVAEVEFSVVEKGGGQSAVDTRKPGSLLTKLAPMDVILPELVTDEWWSVDVAGYNFRHVFELSDFVPTQIPGRRIELRYVFTGPEGEKSIVTFDLQTASSRLAPSTSKESPTT